MINTPLPVLYSFRRCPYAMRARLAIAAAQQTCELREVSLKTKPAEMMAASSKATVPVLVLPGGAVVDESLDIMLWALSRNDPVGCLPAAADRGAMLELIAQNDGPFKAKLDRYKYPNRYPEDLNGPHARDAALLWLQTLNQRLADQPWLFGQRRTLADMAIAPFIRQFAHTDRAWFDGQPLPHLQQWLEAFLASPNFVQVMEKYEPWIPGDKPISFPPDMAD